MKDMEEREICEGESEDEADPGVSSRLPCFWEGAHPEGTACLWTDDRTGTSVPKHSGSMTGTNGCAFRYMMRRWMCTGTGG